MKPLLSLALLSSSAFAVLRTDAVETTTPEDFADRRNFVRIGARALFDVGVRFRNTGGSVAHFAGPAAGGGLDRSYADGFVRVDGSGNDGGQTWFWGYHHDAQYRPAASALDLHAYEGNPYGGTFSADEGTQWGGELAYTRIIGPCWGGRWGLDLGFDWMDFDVDDAGTFAGNLTQITDTYSLAGVVPPSAPYAGTSAGPGPLLSDSPTRLLGTIPTTVNGAYSLTGNLYGFKLGPMIEIPLGDRLSAQLSAGLAIALFDAEFAYSETASIASGATWVRGGRTDSQDWLFGGYGRVQLTARLTDSLGLFGAAEYQGLEGASLRIGGREANVDFDSTLALALGITFRF